MKVHELTPLIEALLFAADQPLTLNALQKAVGDPEVTVADVKKAIEGLLHTYDVQGRGFQLVKHGNGYQILTREQYAPWVQSMLQGRQKARLSRAALETAAVVAYKQPIARMDVERIRGVDAGGVLNTLLERNLITIKGRDPGPGRPLLYGTTQTFLEYFGLSKLGDLPRMEEITSAAQRETGIWSAHERARFERYGVEPDSVEPPGDPETGASEELPDEERLQHEDRAGFQEVVSDLAGDPEADFDPGLREEIDRPDPEDVPEPPETSLHPGT